MRYYRLSYRAEARDLGLPYKSRWSVEHNFADPHATGLLSGIAIPDWPPEGLELIASGQPNLEDVPYFIGHPSSHIVSNRVRRFWEDRMPDQVQFLPVRLRTKKGAAIDKPFWIANFLRRVACLQVVRSSQTNPKTGEPEPEYMWKYALDVAAVPEDAMIFRDPRYPSEGVFICESLFVEMLASGIVGYYPGSWQRQVGDPADRGWAPPPLRSVGLKSVASPIRVHKPVSPKAQAAIKTGPIGKDPVWGLSDGLDASEEFESGRWRVHLKIDTDINDRLRQTASFAQWPSSIKVKSLSHGPIEDFVHTAWDGNLVSEKFRNVLEGAAPGQAEFLPVEFELGEQLPAGLGRYWVVHWLRSSACLVDKPWRKGSHWDLLFASRTNVAVDPALIPEGTSVCRVETAPEVVVIRADLGKEIIAQKITGVVFVKLPMV